MRKIYFVIFGIALVILILLVDWRKKFDTLTGKKLAETVSLGRFESAESAAGFAASEDSMLDFPSDYELDHSGDLPELDWQNDLALPSRMLPGQARAGVNARNTAASPPSATLAGSRAQPNPAAPNRSQPRPSFQDVSEQPYLEESRQLLRQTVRNYDRIISPAPKPPSSGVDKP